MKKLLEVQEVDSGIAAVDDELSRLPSRRQACQQDLEAAGAAVEVAKADLDTAEQAERRLEGQMKDQEAQTAKLTTQMNDVTSQQAYEALQREIQHHEEAGSEFETQALELMETIDQATRAHADSSAKLADLEASTPETLAAIDTEEQRLRGEREKLTEQRLKRCEGIPDDLLARYEKVAAKRTPAVVVLTNNICGGCRVKPPAMLLSAIRRAVEVEACPSCLRLLLPHDAGEA